jgi:hypothetical protein
MPGNRFLLDTRFLRVDDAAQTNGLDDVGSVRVLINKGADSAVEYFSPVRDRFINGVQAAPWRNLTGYKRQPRPPGAHWRWLRIRARSYVHHLAASPRSTHDMTDGVIQERRSWGQGADGEIRE